MGTPPRSSRAERPPRRQAGCGVVAAAVCGLALAVPGPAWAQTRPSLERLSDPGRLSRWAFVLTPSSVLSAPRYGARRVARLRTTTEDGTDELVLLLARRRDVLGRDWVRVRLPIRPNGTTGWIRRDVLGGFRRVDTWLRIDRRRLRVTLIKAGRVVFRAPAGVGRPGRPTPAGDFYIRTRLSGYGLGSIYGPLAFGTSARAAVTDWPGGAIVGVHGTDQPQLIPGRISNGCIRLRNRDVRRLGALMPVGTPVTIR